MDIKDLLMSSKKASDVEYNFMNLYKELPKYIKKDAYDIYLCMRCSDLISKRHVLLQKNEPFIDQFEARYINPDMKDCDDSYQADPALSFLYTIKMEQITSIPLIQAYKYACFLRYQNAICNYDSLFSVIVKMIKFNRYISYHELVMSNPDQEIEIELEHLIELKTVFKKERNGRIRWEFSSCS